MAVWDTAYVNDLPDSAFLLIAPGGKKDGDGKTVPRDLRYFPVRNAAGDVDAAHLRNALARIPQASNLTSAQRMAAMDKAKSLAKADEAIGGPSGTYAGTAGSGRAREPAVLETRTFEFSLELRDAGNGRTLIGRAVPYGETANVPKGTERFVFGAFARQIAAQKPGTVKLYGSHSDRMTGQNHIGRTTSLTEMLDGLHGSWEMFDTPKAEETLTLVRINELTGLSIGFKTLPGGTRRAPDGADEQIAAHLDHVALTLEPAYKEAGVMAVRSDERLDSFRTAQLRQHQVLERNAVRL